MERIIEKLIESKNQVKLNEIEGIKLKYFDSRTMRRNLIVLKAYYDEHGSLSDIKGKDVYEYHGRVFSVGGIIISIRNAYKAGGLTKDEINILNSMGIVWEKHATSFEKRIAPLIEYVNNGGTLSAYSNNTVFFEGKNVSIRNIISVLKIHYKDGLLSQPQIDLLKGLGIDFEEKKYDLWEVLEAYYLEYGTIKHVKRNSMYEYDGKVIDLGAFLNRLKYKYNTGTLSEDKIKRLEEMGMLWVNKLTIDDKIEIFTQYAKEHGSIANIRYDEKYEYQGEIINIGSILINLRRQDRVQYLTAKQRKQLDNLGIVWNINDERYKKILEVLKFYYNQYGDLSTLYQAYVEYEGKEYDLMNIRNTLRNNYMKGTLSQEFVEQLEEMGIVWNSHKVRRDFWKEVLQAYYDEHGTFADMRVSDTYKYKNKYHNVGKVLFYYRRLQRLGELDQETHDWLDERGMVWEFVNLNKDTIVK